MFINNFEPQDRKIFTGALLVLLASLSLTIFDDWVYTLTEDDLGDLEEIGSVEVAKNDVRRRYKVAFSWAPLKKENQVFQGDSIFTGDGSEAIIKTVSGEEIIIAENSLVVINARKDSLSIDIGFGSIEGRVGKGKKLLISSNNNITELDGSDAKIRVDAGDGKKLILNVIEGEVEVRSGEGVTRLTRNDSAELSSPNLPTPETRSIRLGAPLANQVYRFVPGDPTQFNWETDGNYPRMKIQVANNPSMQSPLVDRFVDSNSYLAFNLPSDQKLYWQVLAEGAQSKVGDFILLDDSPATPILPQQGEIFFFDAGLRGPLAGSPVTLQWDGGSPARRYQVQLSDSQLFTNLIRDLNSEQKSIDLPLLAQGEYYWRVRSLEFSDTPWSEVAFFRVNPEPTQELAPPRPEMGLQQLLITKIHGLKASEISNYSLRGYQKITQTFPVIQWSKVVNAERYDLQIARTRSFRNPIVTRSLAGNQFTWQSATPGTYFWRIRARGEGFIDGTYSPSRRIQVKVQAPVTLSQSSYVDEVPDKELLKAAPPPLEISWNPTVFTSFYEVIFSANPDFKDTNRFVTAKSKRKVQLAEPGKYYWRVRSLNNKNSPVSDFSPVNVLEFQRFYRDPELSSNLVAVSPRQGASILLVGEGESEILFKWNKPFEKAKYQVEIGYDVNFKRVAYRIRTPNNMVAFKKPLASSIIYWRVRAKTPEGITPWTGANRFLVSYEKTPFDAETSERMYYARQKARDRQKRMLAAVQRRLQKLRTPAGTVDIQLETPVPTFLNTEIVVRENIPPGMTALQLGQQPMSKNYAQMSNRPLLTWKKVPAAERYFIEISRDPNFENIVAKAPSFNPYYFWENARPGQFYWRVQAFNERYKRSNLSKARPLRIKTAAPASLSPDNFVEVFSEPPKMWPPPSPFTLEWTPRLFARSYQIQFSEDPEFRYAKTFESKDSRREFRVSKIGNYFWRVRPLNGAGVGISDWSRARSIEVTQAQRAPASISGLAGIYPLDRTMLFVGQGLMNLVFYFNNTASRSSVLELATDSRFKNVIARAASDESQLKISKDLPEGKLYWRVGTSDARGPANVSETWSKIYEFILKKEPEGYRKAGSR